MKPDGPLVSLRGDLSPTKADDHLCPELDRKKLSQGQQRLLALVSEGVTRIEDLLSRFQREGSAEQVSCERSHLLRELYDLEAKGLIRIAFPCSDELVRGVHEEIHRINDLCGKSPGLWNVVAYEREWDQYGDFFDFLDPQAPNYWLKRFQRKIYLEQIEAFLDGEIPRGARVLDAGGGVGRFSHELLRRGHEVFLVDSSERALKCALRHLEEAGSRNCHLVLGDAARLPQFPDGFFQAVFAIELVCYCTEPERVVEELCRVTTSQGWLFFSVEGKYGSMLADSKIQAEHFFSVMDEGELLRKQDLYVRYYTDDEFRDLLERHGLKVVHLAGTHYVPDGVFHRFVDGGGLENGEIEGALLAIESRCRTNPILRPLARAWVAVCQKK